MAVKTRVKILPKVVGVFVRTRHPGGFKVPEELLPREFFDRINALSITLNVMEGKDSYTLTLRELGGSGDGDKPGIFALYADKPRDVGFLSFNQALEAAKTLPHRL